MSLKMLNLFVLKFIFFSLSILLLTKAIIFFSFGNNLHLNKELFNAFWIGFRFDLKLIATIVLLFAYLPYLLTLKKLPYTFVNITLSIVLVIISTLSFINFGYYKFFGSEFNSLFFGIINDGTKEVLLSIFLDKSLLFLTFVALVIVSFIIYLWQKTKLKNQVNKKSSYTFLIIIILINIAFARGSFGTFPLSKKTINNVDNSFLSNALLNPIWQLYYAYSDLKLNQLTSSKKVLKKHKIQNYQSLLTSAGFTKDNPLKITTAKDTFLEENKPHVIFVLMESWSSHIAIFDKKENNVLGEFAKHSKEDYFFLNFFSNAYGTNPTIEELLLNSPIKDLSQSKGKNTPFSLFSLLPYKSKGYKTTFLSGGSSNWRNHNKFWKVQGFNNYIGRASIEKYFNTTCDNTWGVYDELLFDYLKQEVLEKNNDPQFTFLLTTNNHPPIELPKNFKMPKINLNYYGLKNSDNEKKVRLSAYHYQTDALGKFLTWLKKSKYKDNTIVIATGDHIIKGFKEYKSPKELFYKYAVPLYFYIPKKYDKFKNIDVKKMVGSHNDIFPTLYNLTLSNASYYNFGTSIMKKNHNMFGWNEQGKYIFKEGVANKTSQLFNWDQNLTLKLKPKQLSNTQINKINELKYKNILIEYLLNQEYEESSR